MWIFFCPFVKLFLLMEFTLTTPALLFPAISLLLLAYTNRFLAIATLVRSLHANYQHQPNKNIMGQIKNLRMRLKLIRAMQAVGSTGLLMCVLCMFLLFYEQIWLGKLAFGVGLLMLMISLTLSVWEIQISVRALNIQLSNLEEPENTSL